jgi:hypothetical protein
MSTLPLPWETCTLGWTCAATGLSDKWCSLPLLQGSCQQHTSIMRVHFTSSHLLRDLRFLQQHSWGFKSSGTLCCTNGKVFPIPYTEGLSVPGSPLSLSYHYPGHPHLHNRPQLPALIFFWDCLTFHKCQEVFTHTQKPHTQLAPINIWEHYVKWW